MIVSLRIAPVARVVPHAVVPLEPGDPVGLLVDPQRDLACVLLAKAGIMVQGAEAGIASASVARIGMKNERRRRRRIGVSRLAEKTATRKASS